MTASQRRILNSDAGEPSSSALQLAAADAGGELRAHRGAGTGSLAAYCLDSDVSAMVPLNVGIAAAVTLFEVARRAL
jgi:hypothetical protein